MKTGPKWRVRSASTVIVDKVVHDHLTQLNFDDIVFHRPEEVATRVAAHPIL